MLGGRLGGQWHKALGGIPLQAQAGGELYQIQPGGAEFNQVREQPTGGVGQQHDRGDPLAPCAQLVPVLPLILSTINRKSCCIKRVLDS